MKSGKPGAQPKQVTPIGRLFTKKPALGGAVAEQETDLTSYFVDDENYLASIREKLPGLFIFVGPKGVGKSAIQKMIEEQRTLFEARVISIKPEDVALWTLVKSSQLADDVYKDLDQRWLNKLLWNYLFVLEILRHEFGDASSFLTRLGDIFKSDMSRVRRLIEKGINNSAEPSLSSRFLQVIEEIRLSGKLSIGPGEGAVEVKAAPAKTDKKPSGNVLNDLSTVTNKLKNLLDHDYIVLLDDLDQNWSGDPRHVELLEALLSSLQNLCRTGKVTFVVALRDDIYRALRPDDPDKLRQAIRTIRWSQKSLKAVVRERIRWATGNQASKAEGFPEIFQEGLNLQLLWDVCGHNARRTLSVFEELISEARREGYSRIDADLLRSVLEKMSGEFLRDLDNLYRQDKPGLEFIARSARKVGKQFSLSAAQDFALDFLVRLERHDHDWEKATWAQSLAESPEMFVRMLLETEFLLYKSSRVSTPVVFSVNDVIDDRTWFAVNSVYQLGLGL